MGGGGGRGFNNRAAPNAANHNRLNDEEPSHVDKY